MSVGIAAERRIRGDDFAIVAPSHYLTLGEMPAEEVLALARTLQEHRERLRGLVHANRRARRGKAEARASAGQDTALARRKQVFAAALKRVNHRLDILHGMARRAWHAAALREALARKRSVVRPQPETGDAASGGMRAKPSQKRKVRTDPREIGRVSAFVKAAQAKRDH